MKRVTVRTHEAWWRATLVAVAMAIGGCATTPDPAPAPAAAKEAPAAAAKPAPLPAPKPKPVPPPVAKEAEPAPPLAPAPNAAAESLRKGVQSYDDGDYKEAGRLFALALDQGLAQPADQASAHKHLAFIACVGKRTAACRAEFRKAFDADPLFDLAPAEAGHPMWGPVFRSVKADVERRKRSGAAKSPAPAAPAKPK